MDPERPPAASAPEEPAAAADPGLVADLAVLRGGAAPASGAAPHPRRRRSVTAAVLGVLLLLGALAYGVRLWRQPPEVALTVVTRRDLGVPPVVLSASGHLVARRQITVSSKAQGKIIQMAVEESQQVAAGDLVARLEDDEQRATVALAKAEAADGLRELRRNRNLFERGTIPSAVLDAAETRHQVAVARLELAQVALANTILTAPISGTVIRKIRDVGEFLTIGVTAEGDPGTAVVTLADLSAIDVSLDIAETEIRKVALGAATLVTPEAMPDRHYEAVVIEIAAMADRQKGVIPVKVRIAAPDRDLLPDMTARVRFLEHAPAGPIEVLPGVAASAVVERDGRSVVFVEEDGVVTSVPVRTRPVDDETVAFSEGPELGTYLVDAPPDGLASGDAVRVRAP